MLVYLVTNTTNGKRYVGQTSGTLWRRWSEHKRYGNCSALHAAIEKYGAERFVIEPLVEDCDQLASNIWEAFWIDFFHTLAPNGYNLLLGGDRHGWSEEAKRRVSEKHAGRRFLTEAGRRRLAEKLAQRNRARAGTPATPKQLEALRRGRAISPWLGRTRSAETKRRMAEAGKLAWTRPRRPRRVQL